MARGDEEMKFEKIEDEGKSIRIYHKNKCGSLRATIKSPKATELSLKIQKAFDDACHQENKDARKKCQIMGIECLFPSLDCTECIIHKEYQVGYCPKTLKLIEQYKKDREATDPRSNKDTEVI